MHATEDPLPAPAAPEAGHGPAETAWRGPDRRRRPTPRLSRYTFFGGRRRGGRRAREELGTFVDQYSPRLFGLLVWVALMNAGDSFFTLIHLQAGGIELNPVADWLLGSGRFGFVLYKSILITLPLMVLCLHKNFPLARLGLWAAAGTYTLLLGYHLSLF